MQKNYNRLKIACYSTNICMSVVGNLPPILFLTFRSMYGISYSLLGLLVVINFATQLTIDLIFSFFSHKFNIEKVVKFTPALTAIGLALFAAAPVMFPDGIYAGLVLGTVIFSASSGFAEVLISPVIAAIPADDPDREMSKLHSIYAWGVVGVVIFSTLFLLLFGGAYWQILVLLFIAVPVFALIMYYGTHFPEMETPEKVSGALSLLKNKGIWLCVLAIFLGGSAECTMAQWCSSYLEKALGIEKVWGDIFGVALFAVMLGLGRSLYAKYGRSITKVLLCCAIGSTVCYLVAAVSPIPVIGLIACGLTGIATSMLWPGNLIVASDKFPAGGVFIFALMAAGGDSGAAFGPQLVGLITDGVMTIDGVSSFAQNFGMTAEQLGMKTGMLVGALFPLIAVGIYVYMIKKWNSK